MIFKDLTMRSFNFRTDLDGLFDLMCDYDEQRMFHCFVPINSNVQFQQWMINNFKQAYLDFSVIVDKRTSDVIGYAYTYDYRCNDLVCKVCLLLNKKYRDSGLGAIATIKYLDKLFTEFPIRKVYFEIYDYNKQSLSSNLQAGFKEEGCLKEYRYHDGVFHDLHILAMSRQDFYKFFEAFLCR